MKKLKRTNSKEISAASKITAISSKFDSEMTSTVVKKYDELIRCTNVLTEGVESEFLRFVSHQEQCRKKWLTVEEDNHDMKKFMAKYKADKDTLEVKLNMARHQLDAEIKKRLKAEQSVDHMARQLQLIKELLLDKDSTNQLSLADKQALALSINQYSSAAVLQEPEKCHQADLLNQSYTLDESSIDLPASEYDNTEDDILDVTGGSMLGGGNRRKSTKRGLPSAPLLNVHDSIESEECYVKRTRVSEENKFYSVQKYNRRKRYKQVHKTIETHVSVTGGSPSKNVVLMERLDQDFPRPPPQNGRRPPTHVKSSSSTDMTDYETGYNKENNSTSTPSVQPFMLTRHHHQKQPHQQYDQQQHTSIKGLTKQSTVPNLYPSLDEFSPDPKRKFNTLSTPRSARKTLAHNFVTKVAVRMETCGPCKKKARFGSSVYKCKECKAICHVECKDQVPMPCVPIKDTPGRKEGTIEYYIGSGPRKVPAIVTNCIEEVERRGLRELGIYRVPGMDKDVKELKEKFLRGKTPDLTKISDIHVVCGCLKDFIRGLSESLVTFALHESFIIAATLQDEDDSISGMYQCISELPLANRETLAALMLHLQKVGQAYETQMSIANLSKVFGPTLVGHRSQNPTHMEMLEDTKFQPIVVGRLLEMPTDYWNQLLNGGPQVRTPPYNPNYFHTTPTTPECKPAPQSRLGPLDEATPSRGGRKAYNAMIPKHSSNKDPKRNARFFNSPS